MVLERQTKNPAESKAISSTITPINRGMSTPPRDWGLVATGGNWALRRGLSSVRHGGGDTGLGSVEKPSCGELFGVTYLLTDSFRLHLVHNSLFVLLENT